MFNCKYCNVSILYLLLQCSSHTVQHVVILSKCERPLLSSVHILPAFMCQEGSVSLPGQACNVLHAHMVGADYGVVVWSGIRCVQWISFHNKRPVSWAFTEMSPRYPHTLLILESLGLLWGVCCIENNWRRLFFFPKLTATAFRIQQCDIGPVSSSEETCDCWRTWAHQ